MLRKFQRDDRGSVALMFAASVFVLLMTLGTALDYSQASGRRAELQRAVDATTLKLGLEALSLSGDSAWDARARQLIAENYSGPLKSLRVTHPGQTVTVSAVAAVKNNFITLAGYRTFDVEASSTTFWGTKRVEVVMALDNTGSMDSSNKLTSLKTAANSLIDILRAVPNAADNIRIGLVPFSTDVRVRPSDFGSEPWIDFSGGVNWCDEASSNPKMRLGCVLNDAEIPVQKLFWEGCIVDRDKPYDTDDSPVTSDFKTRYRAAQFCNDREELQYVQPLTNNFTALKQAVNAMSAGGNTNVTIGITWGMALLSSTAPFTTGRPTGEKGVEKYLIILTDGENTQNRYTHKDEDSASKVGNIDARTKQACKAARDAKYTVYSIRVIDGNGKLLEECASDKSKYFDVRTASQLDPVFQSIAQQIAQLRLTE